MVAAMNNPRLPPQALESFQQKLKAFRTRLSRVEWKAFEVSNVNLEQMDKLISAHKFEEGLLRILNSKTRLPCVVCQGHQGVIYCSVTYTSKLRQKETLQHARFKPPVYCVFYATESVFYTTRSALADVVSDALVELFGGTRLVKLPLVGKDFKSLRQLHHNKIHKGKICRRAVKDNHPVDYVRESLEAAAGLTNGMIIDEDLPWKKRKDKYYRRHFCPEKDPIITKFAVSSSARFRGSRVTRHLNCDMKVTFRTENLLTFFDRSMTKGVLSYPLNPFLEKVVTLGSTSISINPAQG